MTSGRWSGNRRPYSKEWHRVRALVKRRSGGQCEHTTQGMRCTNIATDVDHIVNLKSGGTDTLDNAQHLCRQHHQIKTQAEATQARAKAARYLAPEPDPFDLLE